MNKLIEKLKDNKVAWMFLSKEEQECLRQANKKAGVENLKYDGEWDSPINPWADISDGKNAIWRIKPDYQRKSEYVDLEIEKRDGWLGAVVKMPISFKFQPLHCLPSLPNFEGFIRKSEGDVKEKWFIQGVAKQVSKGHKVYARFRA